MKWNWQQADWPDFRYKQAVLQQFERDFLQNAGMFLGAYKHCSSPDKEMLLIELIGDEAVKTSEIEGVSLNRESVQSSLRRNFGLAGDQIKTRPSEQGIADLMTDLYKDFHELLSHATLFKWQRMLAGGRRDLKAIGHYRSHPEPMQVVSGKVYEPRVHFEAPPSKKVPALMNVFIKWFNDSAPLGKNPLSPLTRAGIAHLYFVSIHPFEDGNGRIARALAEKVLSQSINAPLLTKLSTVIQDNKKSYYDALEENNKNTEITSWLLYFSKTILTAQMYTQQYLDFLIEKTRLYDRLRGKLNPRQDKALARMFKEGITGFKGGLSAENYLSITGTTRATATRDLQDLVAKGALLRTGKLKQTRYSLNIAALRKT